MHLARNILSPKTRPTEIKKRGREASLRLPRPWQRWFLRDGASAICFPCPETLQLNGGSNRDSLKGSRVTKFSKSQNPSHGDKKKGQGSPSGLPRPWQRWFLSDFSSKSRNPAAKRTKFSKSQNPSHGDKKKGQGSPSRLPRPWQRWFLFFKVPNTVPRKWKEGTGKPKLPRPWWVVTTQSSPETPPQPGGRLRRQKPRNTFESFSSRRWVRRPPGFVVVVKQRMGPKSQRQISPSLGISLNGSQGGPALPRTAPRLI